MVECAEEVGWLRMAKCTIFLTETVGDGGSEVQFNDFQGFSNDVTQNTVEIIGSLHLLERNTALELVARRLKRQTESTEPVVVHVLQEINGDLRVSDYQAS